MQKAWRVILSIVLVVLIIGAICIAVGFMTGADVSRILQTSENNGQLSTILSYAQWAREAYQVIAEAYAAA